MHYEYLKLLPTELSEENFDQLTIEEGWEYVGLIEFISNYGKSNVLDKVKKHVFKRRMALEDKEE